MAKRQATSVPNYGDMLAVLRHFYDGYTPSAGYHAQRLTPARKAAITRKYRAHRAFEDAAFGEVSGARWIRVKSRKAEALERVRELGPGAAIGYPKAMKGWAVVGVPGDIVAVGVTAKGRPVVTDEHGVKIVFERYDPLDMARDPAGVARNMMRRHPKASRIAVRAGEYGWAKSRTDWAEADPNMIEATISYLLYRYGADTDVQKGVKRADRDRDTDRDLTPTHPDSNYFANWVTGMVAIYMPKTVSPGEWREYVQFTMKERRALAAKHRKRSQRERMKGRQG